MQNRVFSSLHNMKKPTDFKKYFYQVAHKHRKRLNMQLVINIYNIVKLIKQTFNTHATNCRCFFI